MKILRRQSPLCRPAWQMPVTGRIKVLQKCYTVLQCNALRKNDAGAQTQHRNMTQTSTERVRLTRDRRRRGVRPVLVEVSQEAVEYLEVNGYLADRSNAAIATAVSCFLVDSASG
jgi:hypothetical protein